MNMKFATLALTTAIILVSCNNSSDKKKEEMIRKNLAGFSEAYFNYDLKRSADFCTPESRKWLCFAASNLTETDLEALRSKNSDATVEIKDITLDDEDSTGVALIKVNDYLLTDSIGKTGQTVDEAVFRLDFTYKNNTCLIRMEGLPQNEKQNHD